VLGHTTPDRQRGDHLINRLAVCDRTPCDAGTNLNGRIFSFHFSESYGKPGAKETLPEKLRAKESPNDRRKLSESVCEGPFRF